MLAAQQRAGADAEKIAVFRESIGNTKYGQGARPGARQVIDIAGKMS